MTIVVPPVAVLPLVVVVPPVAIVKSPVALLPLAAGVPHVTKTINLGLLCY
jgi:hypothetical protein